MKNLAIALGVPLLRDIIFASQDFLQVRRLLFNLI